MTQQKSLRILAVNPGSTSTKIAIYEDHQEVCKGSIEHPNEEISKYERIADQYGMRKEAIEAFLKAAGYKVTDLDAVVGRGGLLPPVKSGAYRVNTLMVDRLRNRPVVEHASNLGALIAFDMAESNGLPAFIYDSVAVDEMEALARFSGYEGIPRESFSHALNSRASALKFAEKLGKPYNELNLIVAHLGGGISISAHSGGRMVDVISDDDGPFSPERAGRVPCKRLVDLCFSGKMQKQDVKKIFGGKGGLTSYLGTNSALVVQERMDQGDETAALVYEAMAYQVAKGIGEMGTVLKGKIDGIIMTGGIAYSKLLTGWIDERVSFMAPVILIPGENELEALAMGAWRVLKGQEMARTYSEE